ncbi:MAG: hypothetical protein ABSE87_01995 [Terracidiphilus sp.]
MSSRWSVGICFAYGFTLALFGVMVARAEDGNYVLLWLAGSPFSVVGDLPAVIASILQWGLLVLARRRLYIKFWVVAVFLLVHYAVAAALIIQFSQDVGDWEYLWSVSREVRLIYALGLVCYVLGQCFVWGTSLPKKRRP